MSGLGWAFIVIGFLSAFMAWACVAVGADYERMCEQQEKEQEEDKR